MATDSIIAEIRQAREELAERFKYDDMVLELAVAARCDAIVTHNRRHFRGVQRFGIRVLRPAEFLREIGG